MLMFYGKVKGWRKLKSKFSEKLSHGGGIKLCENTGYALTPPPRNEVFGQLGVKLKILNLKSLNLIDRMQCSAQPSEKISVWSHTPYLSCVHFFNRCTKILKLTQKGLFWTKFDTQAVCNLYLLHTVSITWLILHPV